MEGPPNKKYFCEADRKRAEKRRRYQRLKITNPEKLREQERKRYHRLKAEDPEKVRAKNAAQWKKFNERLRANDPERWRAMRAEMQRRRNARKRERERPEREARKAQREAERAKAKAEREEEKARRKVARREAARLAKELRRGMTVKRFEHFEKHLAAQQGVCAICKGSCPVKPRLAIDHDHATGQLRGLLCHNCNVGLGQFKDRPDLLEAAITYLSHWQTQS